MSSNPNGRPFLLNPSAPAPNGSSAPIFPQARVLPGSHGTSSTIYISGIASVLEDGSVAGFADGQPDVRVQTAIVLQTIDKIISGASNGKGGIANMIDAVVYLTDMKRDYAGMNEEWNKVFGNCEVAPARATIGVKDLPSERFVAEVKAVAVVPA